MLVLAFVLSILLFVGVLLTVIFKLVFGIPSFIVGSLTGYRKRFNLFDFVIPTVVFVGAVFIIIKIAQMSFLFQLFN